jgi:hypothetical protein
MGNSFQGLGAVSGAIGAIETTFTSASILQGDHWPIAFRLARSE